MRPLHEGWIDVSYAIDKNMVHWPGQPPVKLEKNSDMHCGDAANVSILHLSAHTGTHMDAPIHFLKNGLDIASAPLSILFGPVRVADIRKAKTIDVAAIEDYEARIAPLQAGERILFRTRNSDHYWLDEDFDEGYAAVQPAAAQLLVDRGIIFVGVDYLSVAPWDNLTETHRILLSNNVWPVEGIDLREIVEGSYEMICLPLKIKTSDASPVRMFLRPV